MWLIRYAHVWKLIPRCLIPVLEWKYTIWTNKSVIIIDNVWSNRVKYWQSFLALQLNHCKHFCAIGNSFSLIGNIFSLLATVFHWLAIFFHWLAIFFHYWQQFFIENLKQTEHHRYQALFSLFCSLREKNGLGMRSCASKKEESLRHYVAERLLCRPWLGDTTSTKQYGWLL